MSTISDLSLLFQDVSFCPICQSSEWIIWSKFDLEIPVYRCGTCSVVYLAKRITDESFSKHYQKYNLMRDVAKPELLHKRKKMYAIDRAFLELFTNSGKLLDFGCGSGEFLSLLNPNFKKIGFDIDQNSINAAREQWPNIEFYSSVDELMAGHGTVDTIVFRGTIQYARDFSLLKKQICGLLSAGGKVILLATPHADGPLAELTRDRWGLHNRVEHLVIFNRKSLLNLFHGFEMTHIEFPYLGTPYENHTEDLKKFVEVCNLNRTDGKFPFWGSMLNAVFEKKV